MKSIIRPSAVLLGSAAIAVALTGCSGYVNGDHTLSHDDIEYTLPSLPSVEIDDYTSPSTSSTTTSVPVPEGVRVVPKAELETKVRGYLEDKAGTTADDFACAGGLTMVPGETQDCAVFSDDEWLEVTVKVNPEGSSENTNIQVGDEIPKPSYAN